MEQSPSEKYDKLVCMAYSGPRELPPWKLFLAALAEITEARDASILIRRPTHPQTYFLMTSDADANLEPTHLKKLFSTNTLLDYPHAEAKSVYDLMSTDDFLRSSLYRKFLKPLNIKYMLGVDIDCSNGMSGRLALNRTAEQEDFGNEERGLLERIVQHLKNSIELHDEFARTIFVQSFYEFALDKLAFGCIILDEKGKILLQNDVAKRILARGAGLRTVNDELVAQSDEVRAKLQGAIRKALAAHNAENVENIDVVATCFQITSLTQPSHIGVIIRPLLKNELLSPVKRPAVVIVLNERVRKTEVPCDTLRGLFGFTKSEAIVALQLANGLTVEEIAEKEGVSINTTKTHIRGAFMKTGVSRQVDLVRLVLQSIAALG